MMAPPIDEEAKLEAVREFFTDSDWQHMTDYDKLRSANIYNNYKTMLLMGLAGRPPAFVVEHERRMKQQGPTPQMSACGLFKVPPPPKRRKANQQNQSSSSYAADFSPPRRLATPCHPHARRSGRDKRQVNYALLEDECDRAARVTRTNAKKLNTRKCAPERAYCGVCSAWKLAACVDHPYTFVKDTEASPGVLTYARESLPDCLQIGVSNIPAAGRGVWAGANINTNTAFGPYTGTVWNTFAEGDKSGYSWEIDDLKTGKTLWLDGGDVKVGNWMRFVNHSNDANLEAMQWSSCIWYVAKKTIHTGIELTVSYGADYGKELEPTEPKVKRTPLAPVKLDAVVNGGAVLTCSQCEKRYTDASLLEQHVKTKHTVSDHQCYICNKYFGAAHSLKIHMATVHEGAKRHQCPTCGKAFGQLSNLVRHIKSIHEGQKFACDECGKQFNEQSNLKRHAATHSGAKPHVCDMCAKGFIRAYDLTTHRNTVHLHIKAHQCPLCEKRFGRAADMREHMRRMHSM